VRIVDRPDQQRRVVEAPEPGNDLERGPVVGGVELAGKEALRLGAAVTVGQVGGDIAVQQLVGEHASIVHRLGGAQREPKQPPPRPRPHDGVTDQRDLGHTHERALVA
jgi:hypothetical protein